MIFRWIFDTDNVCKIKFMNIVDQITEFDTDDLCKIRNETDDDRERTKSLGF